MKAKFSRTASMHFIIDGKFLRIKYVDNPLVVAACNQRKRLQEALPFLLADTKDWDTSLTSGTLTDA